MLIDNRPGHVVEVLGLAGAAMLGPAHPAMLKEPQDERDAVVDLGTSSILFAVAASIAFLTQTDQVRGHDPSAEAMYGPAHFPMVALVPSVDVEEARAYRIVFHAPEGTTRVPVEGEL